MCRSGRSPRGEALITVVAAAIVEHGRLLVVSKKAAPGVFYLPGGKPEPGEDERATLLRELDEELGVRRTGWPGWRTSAASRPWSRRPC